MHAIMGEMIKIIFFDVYGTLAGFKPSRFEIQSQACAYFGLTVTPTGVLRGYAMADEFMNRENATNSIRLRDAEGKRKFFAEYEQLVLRACGHEVTAERAGEIFKRVRQVPYGMAPFDDVTPMLERLRKRGLTIGVISNIDRSSTELLSDLGLTEHVDIAATSGEAGAEKPDSAIFSLALRKANATAEEAVHVGDQPSSDIEGALRLGIRAVLIDRDGNHPWFDRCPRITTMADLPGVLSKIGLEV